MAIAPNTIQKITSFSIYPFNINPLATEFFENISFLPGIIVTGLAHVISLFVLALFWYSLSCGIVKIKSKYKQK